MQKVYEELREERNISIGRSKVQRLMHENGIRAQIKSKYKPQTTKADPTAKAFLNLLNQNFDVTEVNKILGGISSLVYEIRRNQLFNISA